MNSDADMIIRVAQQSKTAGQYQKLFTALVKPIGKWDGLGKDFGPVTKALEALDAIEAAVKADDEWSSSENGSGMNQYAAQQKIDDLREALHKGQRAAREIEQAYDEMNDSYLRMGLK